MTKDEVVEGLDKLYLYVMEQNWGKPSVHNETIVEVTRMILEEKVCEWTPIYRSNKGASKRLTLTHYKTCCGWMFGIGEDISSTDETEYKYCPYCGGKIIITKQ